MELKIYPASYGARYSLVSHKADSCHSWVTVVVDVLKLACETVPELATHPHHQGHIQTPIICIIINLTFRIISMWIIHEACYWDTTVRCMANYSVATMRESKSCPDLTINNPLTSRRPLPQPATTRLFLQARHHTGGAFFSWIHPLGLPSFMLVSISNSNPGGLDPEATLEDSEFWWFTFLCT